ncbi:hypothetical protein D3C81_1864400 [compost metagenome]
MRSVLVDEVQAAVILGNDISAVMLADVVQFRKLRKSGIGIAAWRVKLLCRRQASPPRHCCSRLPVAAAALAWPGTRRVLGIAAAIRRRAFPGLRLEGLCLSGPLIAGAAEQRRTALTAATAHHRRGVAAAGYAWIRLSCGAGHVL